MTRQHLVEVHNLKTWPEYWHSIANGLKTFELRFNDRDYKEGDILVLREWVPPIRIGDKISPAWGGKYTGNVVLAKVKHILLGKGPLGKVLPEGWVAMSIAVLHINDGAMG